MKKKLMKIIEALESEQKEICKKYENTKSIPVSQIINDGDNLKSLSIQIECLQNLYKV
jgi:hypothetical protein